MLDNRPILRTFLCAAGAFGLVFTAAMGGTAVMVTGGLGFPQHERRSAPPQAATLTVTPTAWTDVSRGGYEVVPTLAEDFEAPLDESYFDEVYYEPMETELEGAAFAQEVSVQLDGYARSYGDEQDFALRESDLDAADSFYAEAPVKKEETGYY